MSTIYQELDLVEDLSVSDSIFLGHEHRRGPLLDRDAMRRETTELLRRLDHENISPRAMVRALRPAAQQIVSIARALSQNVRLLIMDEPSSILDDSEVETLFGVVRRLTAEGVGVVYISHRLDEIPRIGSRVTVLSDGRTVATGLPADTPAGELVERMVGRRVDQLYPDRPTASAAGDVLLDVRGITRAPGRARRLLPGPRGRDARDRRPRRRRAHRAAAARLRPRAARRGRGLRRRPAPAAPAGPRPRSPPGSGFLPVPESPKKRATSPVSSMLAEQCMVARPRCGSRYCRTVKIDFLISPA